MRRLVRTVLFFTIAAVLATPVMAEEGKQKKKKKKKRQQGVFALRLPKKLQQSLTDEQKKKVAALRKEYAPKFRAFNKQRVEIAGQEKLRAASKLRRDAKKSGTKGRELAKLFQAALGLDADQKKKWQAVQKEQRTLTREFRKKVAELLDDDQKKLLRPARKKGKKKKNAAK